MYTVLIVDWNIPIAVVTAADTPDVSKPGKYHGMILYDTVAQKHLALHAYV